MCFYYQVTNGPLRGNQIIILQNHYVHALNLFILRALVDVTVRLLRVRLALQYDGRLIQQVILSQCGTVLQVHKIRDVEVGQEGTLSVCLTLL